MEDNKVATRVFNTTEYDKVVTTKDSKMIDASLSRIIHARMKTEFTSVRLNVMTQALHADEGPLPQDLTIQNTYTKMCNGRKNVTVILRKEYGIPSDSEEEDPSGKSGSCQSGARATDVAWNDRAIE